MSVFVQKNTKLFVGKAVLGALLFIVCFLPSNVQAASFLFNPSSGSYAVGSTVPVDVIIDTENASINAVSGVLTYDETSVKPVSIKISDSLVDLWIMQPSISVSDGSISFEGLILNPGFTGKGKIATINFTILAPSSSVVAFSSGSALANDGLGTNLLARFAQATLSTYGGEGETIMTRQANAELPVDPSTLVMDSLRPPVVTGYTLAPERIESFSLQGVTYPTAVVRLWLQESDNPPEVAAIQADMAGNFSYSRDNPYKNLQPIAPASVLTAVKYIFTGTPYRFWLTAEVSGAETPPTQAFDMKVGGFSVTGIFLAFLMALIMALGGFLLYEMIRIQKQGERRSHHSKRRR